jgi:hypothetical protein
MRPGQLLECIDGSGEWARLDRTIGPGPVTGDIVRFNGHSPLHGSIYLKEYPDMLAVYQLKNFRILEDDFANEVLMRVKEEIKEEQLQAA